MKIIITGAGAVGYHLAKMLASESQDIYLIDSNEERLDYVTSHIDVFGIYGDAKSFKVLQEAKIAECDLLIAVTSSEETNLLVSIIAKKLGAKRTIARINELKTGDIDCEKFYHDLGIDTIISPVSLVQKEIKRLIKRAVFTDDQEFEGGKLTVFGIHIDGSSPLSGRTVSESANLNPNLAFRPIALHRNDETVIVSRDTMIKDNDIVYFISTPESIDKIIEICGKKSFEIDNIMILGGSRIGVLAAESLENDYNVTLIERDKLKCEKIAGQLKRTLVLNIDVRDVESLEEEGLRDMDAFVAVTGDSETNIMSSLVAKNHGVAKTIARVENIDYIHLSQAIGIDTLINKKIIAASSIFKYVRKGEIAAIASLHGVDAEIIEFNVKPGSKITTGSLKELKFPKTATIAGVVRGQSGFIPFGNFEVLAGDRAVVFSLTESIPKVEKFFL
ncbi:MAG: Trk system potassium transporter TrkA [Flavobacteriales bacterium]|nr:Trk system potassium transporter TrkA [Flavobacteriales bacterium]MCB9198344.1 Trk system potassium transporter TrkA [Flavobacteriales bacterium]